MILLEKMQKAKEFAAKVHEGQMYGKGIPYTVHLEAVVKLCYPYGNTAVVWAYLHDVLEDTKDLTRTEVGLVNEFGDHIYLGVVKLSDSPGNTRKQRKKRLHEELSKVDDEEPWGDVLVVKAADRLANMRACVETNNQRLMRVYCGEYEDFKQACQRPGRAEDIWREIDQIYETHRSKAKRGPKPQTV